jgi:hypothetical protein
MQHEQSERQPVVHGVERGPDLCKHAADVLGAKRGTGIEQQAERHYQYPLTLLLTTSINNIE